MQLDLVTHWSRHLHTLSYFKLTCDLLPEDILIHLPSDDTESSFPPSWFFIYPPADENSISSFSIDFIGKEARFSFIFWDAKNACLSFACLGTNVTEGL